MVTLIRLSSILAFVPLLAFGVSNEISRIVSSVESHLQAVDVCVSLAENDAQRCLNNLDSFADENPSLTHSSSNFQFAVSNCTDCILNLRVAKINLDQARAVLQQIPPLSDRLVTNITYVVTNSCDGCGAKVDTILELLEYGVDGIEQTYLLAQGNAYSLSSISGGIDDLKNGQNVIKQNQTLIRNDIAALGLAINQLSNQIERVRSEGNAHYLALSNQVAVVNDNVTGGGGDSGAGSSGGCDCATWLEQILDVLNDVYFSLEHVKDTLDSWSPDLLDYFQFYNSLQEEIEEYYKLLIRRYKEFDSRLPDSLSSMFSDTLNHLNQITDRFRLSQFSAAQSVTDFLNDPNFSGDSPLELSNEGVISLYSAATLDRSYLTQVKIYEALTNSTFGVSNFVDLAWLEDYLLQVQQPYYRNYLSELFAGNLFNPAGAYNTSVADGLSISTFQAVTNFFGKINTPNRRLNYYSFRRAQTNWFDRVETYLLALNGAFDYDEEGKVTDQDKQEFESDVQTVSNDLSTIDYHLESLSNRLSEVFEKYSECVEAFTAEIRPGSSIEVFAGGTFLGFEIPRMSLSLSSSDTLMMMAEPCRSLFSFVWLALLSISSFWLLLRFVKVVTVVFVRGYAFLATFLSPS